MNAQMLAHVMRGYSEMSHKKLQKLCYYAYVWYMVIYNEPIAEIEFEAWVHGPVSKEIYNQYKEYGWTKIPCYSDFVNVDSKRNDFCEKIFELYGHFSADELEMMTHEEEPWKKARLGLPKYESSSRVIKDADIISFYSKNRNEYKEFLSV